MDQITLRVPVTVKSKVTQALKDKILRDSEQVLANIEKESQNLEFQAKRMMTEQAKIDAQGLISLRAKVEEQKQRIAAAKAKAEFERDQAQGLEIGSEIRQGQLEQTVEVKVGDDLGKLMGMEILLEDDKIIAFRQ
ncbi:YlqD family protein [Megasphaera vaginalis (ex Srinivasan et al. 2021)]|uniref:YlqD protein n=1 Tax=Megasphaera vaginalis (ex Srinivasan et al. 2021) TaxID=1111454 RepID=U7UQI7_9FIRM|nr:YlqD family protein [Megasphaera vaginalis (ex Srinivasan et al. 2021)]ERT61687.1 YlqD protein [Megasphaera vaginalis (ex Srinivasan et al. 2021)]